MMIKNENAKDGTMSNFDTTQDLLAKVSDQLKKRQDAARSGEKFNGFEICRIGDDELRHSAIIAAMLDPQGTHGLGNESLKAFFCAVGCPELVDKCDDCSVETEYSIEHRRMDLVISNRNLCVVIENKTATADHFMQLKDYRKWLETQPMSLKMKKLFYLTYHGDDATDANIRKGEYSVISYKKDICNWMLKCSHLASEKNLQVVQAFCHQYYTYLQQITEANMTQKEMNELKGIILHDASSFESAKEIADNFYQIRKEAIVELLTAWATDRVAFNGLSDGRDLCLRCERDGLVYAFGFSSHKFYDFYYGIRWDDGGEKTLNNNEFPAEDGWMQNAWFPYSKYFEGKYRNMETWVLFDKGALYRRLDDALKEMKDLIKKIK